MLIDTHCHLDFPAFDLVREDLLANLEHYQLDSIIVPAIHSGNWHSVLSLCSDHPRLHAALGIHPGFIEQSKEEDCQALRQLVLQHQDQLVAIGECGLDFSLDTVEQQRHYFTFQIQLACELALPLIIHHRRSHDIIWAMLRKYQPPKGGVIHAFSGSLQQAERYIDLGFKLGVGGGITYSRARKTRDVVSRVPLGSLVLETDAPDMPIYGRQGQINSPAYLGEIFSVLAVLRSLDPETLAQQLSLNSRELFGL